jgi:thiamine biosynthesis lipoprotein
VATGRAFDPTVGALVDAWDLRGAGRVPSPAVLAEALNAVGGSAFSLDAAAGTVTRHHRRAWIDTGSFGKGAALRSVRRVLEGHGVRRAVVDFGGQLLVVGGAEEARGEEVLVAHPRHRDSPVCRLVVRDASVSTTSNSERFLVVEGEELGHVIDPRSGRLSPSWGSVSVVSRDPLAADALSTALFVMGPEEGARWASTLTDIGVLFLEAGDGAPIPTWNAALERSLADPARPCVHEAIPEREDR